MAKLKAAAYTIDPQARIALIRKGIPASTVSSSVRAHGNEQGKPAVEPRALARHH